MSDSWTKTEVDLIVADYFDMLLHEIRMEPLNKTAHRKLLSPLLNSRSDGSIERKHQNISAILLELGYPFIIGYKPLRNYQALLKDRIIYHLAAHADISMSVQKDVDRTVQIPTVEEILSVLTSPPAPDAFNFWQIREYPAHYDRPAEAIVKVNYLAREARNRSIGNAGEVFAANFERARLRAGGKDALADKVEIVSESRGETAGFDVLSFETSGKERFVEVKTTSYGKQTPFFVTRKELNFSLKFHKQYNLYRIFNFRQTPGLYQLAGTLIDTCRLEPVNYIAGVK